MRVIGGTLGGRIIQAPKGTETRPTSDRVKESLFSILGPPPKDALVLDLFAGSGALGIESLSRGALHVTFVDKSRRALDVVARNLKDLDLVERATLLRKSAQDALCHLGSAFDWIFVDPPYASALANSLLEKLGQSHLLKAEGVLIVEHDGRNAPVESVGNLKQSDQRRYGDTTISFYSLEAPDEQP